MCNHKAPREGVITQLAINYKGSSPGDVLYPQHTFKTNFEPLFWQLKIFSLKQV